MRRGVGGSPIWDSYPPVMRNFDCRRNLFRKMALSAASASAAVMSGNGGGRVGHGSSGRMVFHRGSGVAAERGPAMFTVARTSKRFQGFRAQLTSLDPVLHAQEVFFRFRLAQAARLLPGIIFFSASGNRGAPYRRSPSMADHCHRADEWCAERFDEVPRGAVQPRFVAGVHVLARAAAQRFRPAG